MQGRIAGFFMTLFMALPLAAIPLMSIFGVPQLGSLASSLEGTGFLLEAPDRDLQSAASWDLSSAPGFSENPDSGATASQTPFAGNARESLPVSSPAGLGYENSQPIRVDDELQSLSWEQSIQQLSRYGILDYRLQPGQNAQGFHFACFQRVDGQTTIRFEAEADDPLQALQQALRQVEAWHHQRTQYKLAPLL